MSTWGSERIRSRPFRSRRYGCRQHGHCKRSRAHFRHHEGSRITLRHHHFTGCKWVRYGPDRGCHDRRGHEGADCVKRSLGETRQPCDAVPARAAVAETRPEPHRESSKGVPGKHERGGMSRGSLHAAPACAGGGSVPHRFSFSALSSARGCAPPRRKCYGPGKAKVGVKPVAYGAPQYQPEQHGTRVEGLGFVFAGKEHSAQSRDAQYPSAKGAKRHEAAWCPDWISLWSRARRRTPSTARIQALKASETAQLLLPMRHEKRRRRRSQDKPAEDSLHAQQSPR